MTNHTIFLVHGLLSGPLAMWPLAQHLQHCGYQVQNFSYAVWKDNYPDIVQQLVQTVNQAKNYHLVGHSFGGLIIRGALAYGIKPKKIVMLGTPQQPAQLANLLGGNFVSQLFTGQIGAMLADPHFFASLPIPSKNTLGLLAGNLGATFSEPNDGVVTVNSTMIQGCHPPKILPLSHSMLLSAPEAIMQTTAFLNQGSFI